MQGGKQLQGETSFTRIRVKTETTLPNFELFVLIELQVNRLSLVTHAVPLEEETHAHRFPKYLPSSPKTIQRLDDVIIVSI